MKNTLNSEGTATAPEQAEDGSARRVTLRGQVQHRMNVHERIAKLHHELAKCHATLAEESPIAQDWVDQNHSPLGRRKHIKLVKSGRVPGSKDGRRYLIKRCHLDAYLLAHPAKEMDPKADDENSDEDEELLATIGVRRAG